MNRPSLPARCINLFENTVFSARRSSRNVKKTRLKCQLTSSINCSKHRPPIEGHRGDLTQSMALPDVHQLPLTSSPLLFDSATSFEMADKNNDQHHGNEPAETAANTVGTRAPSIPNNPSEDDHPPSGQQTQELAEMNILPSDDAQEHDSDTDVDPAEQIDDFDWDFLHERYHDAMSSASAQELALMQEFAQLMDVPCLCI